MRLVFAGTPEAAVPSLRALAGSAHTVVAVITRTDAPLGRKRVLTPSPVAVAATELGLNVLKANRLDADLTTHIAGLEPDLGVIVAYGGLVREPLLSTPRHGWINLHFSLLPRWRGAAPVQRALMAGDTTTGMTVFQLVPELDAGDILATRPRQVGADETSAEMLESMASSGSELLLTAVDDIAAGTARPKHQQGETSYAAKLSLDDARLDWESGADEVYNRIRAVSPEPGAFSTVNGARVKVLAAGRARGIDALAPGQIERLGNRILAGTADEPLELIRVQPAGKNAMPAADWFRGLAPGAAFDTSRAAPVGQADAEAPSHG